MGFNTSVTASFGADTSGLRRGATEGSGIIEGFAHRARDLLGEVGTGILKAFAVEAVIERLKEMVVQAFENAERLQNLSRELNVSASALQSFNFVVRESGGAADAAQKGWEHVRLALDQLLEGNKGAIETFGKLGLSAKDFVGLSLDQSLEKVARAYEEAKTEAGAYSAIAEILGKRTAPQLLLAMHELAEKGFAGVNEEAVRFGQVVNPDSIEILGTTVRSLGAAWTNVKNGVSELIADVVRLGASIDAIVTGDIRTLKEIWANRNAEIAESEKRIGAAARANNETLNETVGHLNDQKVTAEAILTDYDRQQRSIAETAKGQERLSALANEYTSLLLTAGSSIRTVQEREAAAAEAAKVKAEYEKASAEYINQQAEATRKAAEETARRIEKVEEEYNQAKFRALPIDEQINYLTAQRNALIEDMARRTEESTAFKEDFIELQKTDLELTKLAAASEKQRTEEIKNQIAERKELNALSGTGSPLGLRDLGNKSTVSLEGALADLRSQYQQAVDSFVPLGPNVVAGTTGANSNYYLASQINSIRDELAFRSGFTSAYKSGGTAAAMQYFVGRGGNPLYFDQAVSNMGTWGAGLDVIGNLTKQTNASLDEINRRLGQVLGS